MGVLTYCYVQDMGLLAREIELFFKDLEAIGPAYMWCVINTHMFSHMVTQLEKYGPMREVWMYAFESLNGHIKSLARSNSLPVQAIMNIIKRVKVLRLVRGLIIFITAGVSARMPAAVTMGSRGAIAVEVSARGKRVVLRDDEIQHHVEGLDAHSNSGVWGPGGEMGEVCGGRAQVISGPIS